MASRGRGTVVFGRMAGVAALGALHAVSASTPAEAKTPGTTYCFNTICHRVLTLQTTAALIGREIEHETSYYDGCKQDVFNPCGLTSSGEVFRPGSADNAASPVYPDGTTLLVFNPETHQAAVVRVNNAGPYWGHRKLDVSRATADKLGFRKKGVAKLKVMVISVPSEIEARYRQRRAYEAVPGPIGQHVSMADARRSIGPLMMTSGARYAGLRASTITTGAISPETVAAATSLVTAEADRSPQWGLIPLSEIRTISLPPVAYSGSSRDPLASLDPTPLTAVATIAEAAPAPSLDAGPLVVAAATLPSAPQTPDRTAEPENTDGPGSNSHITREPTIVAAVALNATAVAPAITSINIEAKAGAAIGVIAPAKPSAVVDVLADLPPPAAITPTQVGPPLRYTLGTRPGGPPTIEIAVIRRVDIMTGDNQIQPVLSALPLDVSSDMMERDLNTGRVTQFSPKIALTSLTRAPVGRLGMFARTADREMSVSRAADKTDERPLVSRVSNAVRWARMRITGATDATVNGIPR